MVLLYFWIEIKAVVHFMFHACHGKFGNFTIFNKKIGVYLEKYGDRIMHTFFKTLFQFVVLSKVLCCLQNDNSTLNSDAIQASVNKLFSILKIAKFLTQ